MKNLEVVPTPMPEIPSRRYSTQKRMQLKMAADKKKVMGIKVGCYAYAVVEEKVVKLKIVSISESKDIMKPCYVGFREVSTGRLDTVYLRLKSLKLTRIAAQKELVDALYEKLESPKWKLHYAKQAFDRQNKKYLKALSECNKLAKYKK